MTFKELNDEILPLLFEMDDLYEKADREISYITEAAAEARYEYTHSSLVYPGDVDDMVEDVRNEYEERANELWEQAEDINEEIIKKFNLKNDEEEKLYDVLLKYDISFLTSKIISDLSKEIPENKVTSEDMEVLSLLSKNTEDIMKRHRKQIISKIPKDIYEDFSCEENFHDYITDKDFFEKHIKNLPEVKTVIYKIKK